MVLQKDKDEAEQRKGENDFKTIQMDDRKCTNCLCCLVFLVFIASLVGITGYSIKNGNPLAMITPFDSNGNKCGMPDQGFDKKQNFKDYPYKYMYNLATIVEGAATQSTSNRGEWFKAQCVKKCPTKGQTPECIRNNGATSGCSKSDLYGTTLRQTYCLPDKAAAKAILSKVTKLMEANSAFASSVNDIQICWKAIVGMCAGTILIASLYVFLLKWIVKPVLYISMFLILVLFILFGAWSWMKRSEYDAVTQKKNYDYATAGAGISWGIAGLYACFMLCCYEKIALGASIMEAASAFVESNLRILLLPVIAYILSCIFFAYWAVTAVYLYGVGDVKFNKDLPIATVTNNQQTTYIAWYFLFGLLWVVAFFMCLQQFIIAACTCMWYFNGQGDAGGSGASVLLAVKWGTWYHCGSIALGSFLIALITMIRIVFEYLAHKYEAMAGKDGTLYKIVTCFMRCVLWCLDQYVKFITKNAFIQIALHNQDFCPAAWASFLLIVRHAGRFASAAIIGWIIMMLGKGTIMGLSGYITILIIKSAYPEVQQPFLPAFFVVIVAYVVGSLFLSIFSFACTAILHCFIMAEDTGSSVESPPSLKPFLDENDKQNAKKSSKGETEMTEKKADDADKKEEEKPNEMKS